MRPRMYSSAARSSKRRISHIVSNIPRISSASGRAGASRAEGERVLAMQPSLSGFGAGTVLTILSGPRPPCPGPALQVPLDDRDVAPAPLAARVGQVGAHDAEPAPGGRGRGRPRSPAGSCPPASSSRTRAPPRSARRASGRPMPRPVARGGDVHRVLGHAGVPGAVRERGERRPRHHLAADGGRTRPARARARAASQARRSAARVRPGRRTWQNRSPPPRRRSPRWRPRRRADAGRMTSGSGTAARV